MASCVRVCCRQRLQTPCVRTGIMFFIVFG